MRGYRKRCSVLTMIIKQIRDHKANLRFKTFTKTNEFACERYVMTYG